ncbi:hypothetical protein B9Z19DRAFT_584949 [Tuber borchii]|uniref:Uncharacterized protein n=1 Tax=Tuber borchii TaxID=42251 RepID=A0A2T7A1S3_TUBBO|nr:hypothetical protein B9Z19DRAFT_584949 [Tuber borchii]
MPVGGIGAKPTLQKVLVFARLVQYSGISVRREPSDALQETGWVSLIRRFPAANNLVLITCVLLSSWVCLESRYRGAPRSLTVVPTLSGPAYHCSCGRCLSKFRHFPLHPSAVGARLNGPCTQKTSSPRQIKKKETLDLTRRGNFSALAHGPIVRVAVGIPSIQGGRFFSVYRLF